MILTDLTQRLIKTRPFLINMSCIMGFFTWYIISNSQTITHTMQLPLYVYNLSPERTFSAPEKIDITLSGTRFLLHKAMADGAITLNAEHVNPGKQILSINRENLLLPSAIKVVNYNPVEIILT